MMHQTTLAPGTIAGRARRTHRPTMIYLLKLLRAKFYATHIAPLERAAQVAWRSDGLAVAFHMGVVSMLCGTWLIAPWDSGTGVILYLRRLFPEAVWGAALLMLGRHLCVCVGKINTKGCSRTALALFSVWFYLFISNLLVVWSGLATPILFYAWVRCLWVYFNVSQPSKPKEARPCQQSTIPPF